MFFISLLARLVHITRKLGERTPITKHSLASQCMLALTEAATAALLLVKEYLRVELDDLIGCDLGKGWVVAPFVPGHGISFTPLGG